MVIAYQGNRYRTIRWINAPSGLTREIRVHHYIVALAPYRFTRRKHHMVQSEDPILSRPEYVVRKTLTNF
jgi:hypothetical protein